MYFCEGQIQIGEFTENFIMSLEVWSLDEYKAQWSEGLERLKTHGQTCLVANLQEIDSCFIDWWILYREGDIVYVQNELIAGEYLHSVLKGMPFDQETCYSFIEPRCVVTEDGDKISEWSFRMNS